VRQAEEVAGVIAEHSDAAVVLHLAGQVAVTTSVRKPRADFESNALGTFNVCEAVRVHAPRALLINASTNKVYGSGSADLVLLDGRWADPAAPRGIAEESPLDFHSPYACSKGAAEQYVLDYARTYGLRTVSLRQSCVYGPRQFGIEDQGWVAWFSLAALAGQSMTIYGDGRQVRDILFVDDLVDLYIRCAEAPERVTGRALNVGGGPANVLSLLELVDFLEERLVRPIEPAFAAPRVGDQRVYVSDVSRARELLGWEPTVGVADGLPRLLAWLEDNLDQVAAVVGPRKLAQVVGPQAAD
jgi:CDP-paratose 2-epimerase